MARQVGEILFHGSFFWANGYIGPDGRAVMRLKPPGMTKKELRRGKSELRRICTSRFRDASQTVMHWWQWLPKELRALADRYASQRMVGMMMPGKRKGLNPSIGVLSGMNLSGDAVADSSVWVDMLGEKRDFHERSRLLPQGFVVRGVEEMKACFPKIKSTKLRARVHVHVGMAGQQLVWDEQGKALPVIDHRHVTAWVELDEVEALCKVKLDWKKILQGRKEGDVIVLLGIELGYLRGKSIVRLKCGCRLWVAWAGALEHVPRRRETRGTRRIRVKDRGAVRKTQKDKRPVAGQAREGPPLSAQP